MMLLHRLKIALRLMLRQRFFTGLNLLGLAVGSAAFLLIFAYVSDELGYDQFHTNSDRLYRVNMTNIWIEANEVFGSTGPGVAQAVRNDIPEVEEVVRIHQPFFGPLLIQVRDNVGNIQNFEETDIFAADSTLFDVFTFPLISGDPHSALARPNSAVLSVDYANKYFPDENALGKEFTIGVGDQQRTYQVTGVMENVPDQSHFDFDIMLSMTSFQSVLRRSEAWIWTGFVTYMTLNENADPTQVALKLRTLPAKYVGEERAVEKNWGLYLQKVTDIRLYSADIPNRLGPIGSIDNVIIFSSVAVLILILSCVNFMNLSTARYTERAKEVGIQKILGSSVGHLRTQFLAESTLYALFAVVIGFGFAELGRGAFNTLSGKNISINPFEHPGILMVSLLLVLVIGLLSGSYPAWFLTRFHVLDTLRGGGKSMNRGQMRNGLIIFQFTISIALLAGSVLVKDQLSFLQNKSLGFQSDNVLVIPHMEWMDDNGETYRDRLLTDQIVANATLTNATPPNIWYQENLTPLNSENISNLAVSTMVTDDQFVSTLGLNLIAGRSFFETGDGDSRSVLVNEKCALQMGWLKPGEDPDVVLGKKLAYYNEDNAYSVIGVLKDFNFWSLQTPVEPLAIFYPQADIWKGDVNFLLVKLNEGDLRSYAQVIDELESTWAEMNPQLPFDSRFLDQDFDAAFSTQRRFGQVLDTFTLLAVMIAVLGLIGLISFTTEQRTKEFSIRKVLGASFGNLIQLITLDFIKLLGVSIVLGTAVSWYYANEWLNQFAYRIEISVSAFLIAGSILGLLILVITFVIIRKNALQNPANTLRNE